MAVGVPRAWGATGTRRPCTGAPQTQRTGLWSCPPPSGLHSGPPGRPTRPCRPHGGDRWAGLPAPRPEPFRPREKLVQGEPGGGPESRAPPLPSP